MKKLLALATFILLFSAQARADALWYALESGSKVDLVTGGTVYLTGKIALALCGGKSSPVRGVKVLYPIYSVRIDNLPEIFETRIDDSNRHLTLFGGSGGVEVSGKLSIIAYRDGKIHSVDWVVQQQLQQDGTAEAVVFNRMLQLDGQKSIVSSQDAQQACPDSIELHLVAKDVRRTFSPHQVSASTGEQHTETVTSSSQEEAVGAVTIIATAIPGSLEKIDEKVYKRSKLAEGPYSPSTLEKPSVGQRKGKLLPADYRR